MDVQFTPEEIAFREEVRNFLENDYPPELRGKYSRDEYSKEDFLLWQKTLHKRGWGAPAWPKQYGGTGWTATQRYIFQEECARAETLPIPPFGMAMLAPVLMAFANEEQKAKLPSAHHRRATSGGARVIPSRAQGLTSPR
jgi:alkylation response protein AidB-like acyl-CoA dehydrogenase